MALLIVEDLKKYFPLGGGIFTKNRGTVKAVDGFSVTINSGESLGLVGESGCGKTTVARLIIKLWEPTSGKIVFDGQDITHLEGNSLRGIRRKIQMVFQDPYASLNPRKTVRQILGEPLRVHEICVRDEVDNGVVTLLESVGLSPPEQYLDRYPHEFSGGQRQRIGVARALAVRPKLIVADEPVSSLDISVRAQILNIMADLQRTYGLTYLFITHDLAVVRSVCSSVAVMYMGKIVEMAEVDELYNHPSHPYTEALLAATPIPDPKLSRSRRRIILQGDVPSPVNPPSGCRFRTRCPYAQEKCETEPILVDHGGDHKVACHFPIS